jgi:beta-N-acetylhexosaminidase
MELRRVALGLMLLMLVIVPPSGAARAQGTPQPQTPPAVQKVFDAMTPEERVGQLFLVTFSGTDTGDTSNIYDLIVNHSVGGVVLTAANGNFVSAPDTVTAAYDLTRGLQQIAWDGASNPPVDPATNRPTPRSYVPLFVATAQDGDGPPGDQILSGLTPLPSELAIGATWSPALAQQVGTVMGHELAALGINMYFGPSLDVMENPGATAGNDLGTNVFGGDPFWVSMLGSAYVSGLHLGSQGQLLVVPKHFPGRGSADRSSDQEVATVRKSLDELKQIELAPFFAVTRRTSTPEAMADGLLLSHIRYQGFQGNIRATTKPVSFDAQALTSILGLSEFADWRQAGGIIVSDNLGTKAVRQFYASGTSFPAVTVARDAFVAGNDLLYLGSIVSSDAPDNYATVLGILNFFSKKYREDPAFAQRVDAAVLRILTLKSRLYGAFDLPHVLRPRSGLNGLGGEQQVTFDVARQAATLLSPGAQDLSTLLQTPPKVRDHIVFFTDSSVTPQCATCPETETLGVSALQTAVVQLYGPESGNQTSSFRLSSYSFQDAANYLAGKSPPYLQDNLASAAWIVFALADNSSGQAQLISNFLAEQQDLLRDKRVILFAFGAPYYLDATDISRLTAYYGLYSKQAPFVEVAARLLFQELTPTGASAVSIPSLGYDLISITAPDPNQVIALALDLPAAPLATNAATPEATPVPLFKIGDTIAIRTGTIKDHNGQPVPDGTVVQFSMNLTGEGGGILQQADAVTAQGVARVSFGLDKPGLLEIRASSDPARISDVLQLDVSSAGQPAAVTVIVPQLTPQNPPRAGLTPEPAAADEFITGYGTMRFSAWLLTILILLACAFVVGFGGARIAGRHWGFRWALIAFAGGLLPYNYLALGLPGGADFTTAHGIAGIVMVTMVGLLAGWGAGWLWWRQASTHSL